MKLWHKVLIGLGLGITFGYLVGQTPLQCAVCACGLGMRHHVVAEGEVTLDVDTPLREGVDLMRSDALGIVLSEVPTSRYPELSLGFVTEGFESRRLSVEPQRIANLEEDVYDRLGKNLRDGGAPDVMHGNDEIT